MIKLTGEKVIFVIEEDDSWARVTHVRAFIQYYESIFFKLLAMNPDWDPSNYDVRNPLIIAWCVWI